MGMNLRRGTGLLAFVLATITFAASAHATVTSGVRVRRIKTFNGGTIHITFDRGLPIERDTVRASLDGAPAPGICDAAAGG